MRMPGRQGWTAPRRRVKWRMSAPATPSARGNMGIRASCRAGASTIPPRSSRHLYEERVPEAMGTDASQSRTIRGGRRFLLRFETAADLAERQREIDRALRDDGLSIVAHSRAKAIGTGRKIELHHLPHVRLALCVDRVALDGDRRIQEPLVDDRSV